MTTTDGSRPVDEAKLEQFLGGMVNDMGAALNSVLVMIGVELGLWQALDGAGPVSAATLSETTGLRERYLREWLAAQAASGYLNYDAATDTFELSAEQALVLARTDSPVYLAEGFRIVSSLFRDRDKLAERLRSGDGFGWHEHDPELFTGTEQFFRPGYRTHLVADWLPALDGVVAKLTAGAAVADVGCGHGISTSILAQAFPQSTVYGLDYHAASVERARAVAAEAGVPNAEFAVASATDYPGRYDLICFFDCLHDMGDPVGALQHARRALEPDGTVMLIEPYANDELADNLNPVGRMFYAASTLVCTPSSLAQPVALGLGAQAGPARLAAVAEEAGFSRFRRATETPFNLVLEVRP